VFGGNRSISLYDDEPLHFERKHDIGSTNKVKLSKAEFEILQGMSQLIEKKRPTISLEVGGPGSTEVVRYLVDQGYRPYEFSSEGILEHEVQDYYPWDNLLFVPA
jgi:hypothetical protein